MQKRHSWLQSIRVRKSSGDSWASYALYSRGNDQGLAFYIGASNGYILSALSSSSGINVWDGQWHVATGMFDGTFVRLFVDGIEALNDDIQPTQAPPATRINYTDMSHREFYIGLYNDQPAPQPPPGPPPLSPYNYAFNGSIAEVRVWDGAPNPSAGLFSFAP
ncbi:MAG TPA: LamG-like jellyroll fold domain-containing protein [Candidatus Angelobacter sp.]